MDTGLDFKGFMGFINDYTGIEIDDAFIKGEVFYFDELSTIIVEVKEMNTLLSIRKKIDRNVDSVVGVVFHCNMIVDGIA